MITCKCLCFKKVIDGGIKLHFLNVDYHALHLILVNSAHPFHLLVLLGNLPQVC